MIRRFSPASLKPLLHEPKKRAVIERPVWEGEERPGDEFNRHHAETEVLEWLGFTPSHADYQGEHWTRPGKDSRDGSSATVYSDDEGSHVTIWSDTVVGMFPALEVRRPYDAFGLFVGAFYNGDYAKATKDLNYEGYGVLPEGLDNLSFIEDFERTLVAEEEAKAAEEADRTGWEPVDVWSVLNGAGEPAPDLFERSDGQFMLYRGKVHGFYGEPESLKSWGAQVAVAQAVDAGKDCLILDFENSATAVFPRLIALGMSEQALARSISYIAPSGPFTVEAQAKLSTLIFGKQFAVIVVDGVTDAMALMGLDPEKNKDASTFDHQLLRPLARSGAAVVVIDHVAKNNESRGRWAIGAQHKQAAITGAAFMFEVVKSFGRGLEGMARIEIKKDKPGHLRQRAIGDVLAELHMKSHEDGHIDYEIKVPTHEAGGHRPTEWMVRISDYIEDNPGLPKRAILHAVGGADAPWAETAFSLLIAERWTVDDMTNGASRGYRNRAKYTHLEVGLDIRDADAAIAQNAADQGLPPVNLAPPHLERAVEDLDVSMTMLHKKADRELGVDAESAVQDELDSLLDAL